MDDSGAGMQRPLLALIAWAFCMSSLVPYGLLVYQAFAELSQSASPPLTGPAALQVYGGSAAGCAACAALAWMTLRWVRDRPVHWLWPLATAVLGVLGLGMFGEAALLAAIFGWPAVVFGGALSFWHLRRNFVARPA